MPSSAPGNHPFIPTPSTPISTTPPESATPPTTAPGRDEASDERDQRPPITPQIRARIVAALSKLKGKRGSAFSFVTAGDTPSLASLGDNSSVERSGLQQEDSRPVTLKLAGLLQPLETGFQTIITNDDTELEACISMPSYSASLTLGQTITDPVDSGMLGILDSRILFHHFMLELNARWEYILDPLEDTHDHVRRRSPFLFATILFCSSKFVSVSNGSCSVRTDPFLQTRLCSLARNLAIRAFAAGNRSLETLQAFYLLACWKDPDDDTSYLHSGYAFHVLHDIDTKHFGSDGNRAMQHRRTWLALFRQLEQQNLFFTRSSSGRRPEESGSSLIRDPESWSRLPHALPLDLLSCCGADLRRLQSRIRNMVEHASPLMLPCYIDSLNHDLLRWRSSWTDCLKQSAYGRSADYTTLDPKLLNPGEGHINTILGLWESSVRLNVASAIFRFALTSSLSNQSPKDTYPQSRQHDRSQVHVLLSGGIAGLSDSVQGAFETLRHLLRFPPLHLRQSPDSVLLLGPNAGLYLCLLLSLPCEGILGPSFQKTAIKLVQDVAHHVRSTVSSPQDVVNLHAAYLESLVVMITPEAQSSGNPAAQPPQMEFEKDGFGTSTGVYNNGVIEAAHILAGGFAEGTTDHQNSAPAVNFDEEEFGTSQNLHEQSLANLLDVDFFWDMPGTSASAGTGFL